MRVSPQPSRAQQTTKRATNLLSAVLLNARVSSALITLIAALTLMGATASAQVSVTATAGTVGPTPYTTLGGAFTAINGGTHQGAITIDIQANTTEGTTPATLNSSGAGSALYTSVLIRPTADGVSISGNPATGFGVVQLNGADNVTIDGDNPNTGGTNRNLTIQNTAGNTIGFNSVIRVALAATVVTSANDNTFRNLNLLGNAAGRNIAGATSTSASENNTYGILATAGATTVAPGTNPPAAISSVTTVIGTGATANNLTIQNNSINTAARGVAIQGSAATVFPGLLIENNTIGNATAGATDQVYSMGVTAQGTNNGIIRGNIVYVESFLGGQVRGLEWGSISATGTTALFEKNKVLRVRNNNPGTFGAYGINLGGANTHTVQNNFVADVRNDQTVGTGAFSTTFGALGIRVASGTGHKVYYNSVHLSGPLPGTTSSDLTVALGIAGTGQTGCDVRNNILSNQLTGGNPGGTRHAPIFLPSGATSAMNLTLNNNAYYSGTDANSRLAQVGTTFGTGEYFEANFNQAATTPASNFRSYTSTLSAAGTNDNASFAVSGAPPFVSNIDLHIPNSTVTLLESGGSPIASVPVDIDTDARNATTPDIGADEFSGTLPPLNDMAATAFIDPPNGGIKGTNVPFSPQASFTNFGSNSQTGVTVRYTITNSALVEIYNQTATTGPIGPEGTAPVTFPSTSISSVGTYTMTASAELPGDTQPSNDTIVGSFSVQTSLSGSFNVGSGGDFSSLTNPGGAFDRLNTVGTTSDITINIISDLTGETGAVPLNQIAGGFAVLIQPSGGAARLISGGSATVLLDFNGADRVTIDGLNSGGNSLTIRNTTTGTGTAVRYINDASDNSILNSTLEGGGTTSVLFISTGVTTGNDNIQIVRNIIRDRTDAVSVPFNSINLVGTSATVSNSNILIDHNQIINFLQAGLLVGTSDNVTFTNNDIFQTAARTGSLFGVAVNSVAGTNLFSENEVHDLTTTLGTTGMVFNDARATTVSLNRIYNFPSATGSTGTLSGIVFNGSSGNPASLTVVNNMVSIVPSFTNAQIVRGIFDFGFGGNTYTAYFNTVYLGGTGSGTASTWACVRGTGAPTAFTMLNNICYNNRTGGTGNHFAGGDQSAATGTFVSNYNFFAGTGSTPANFMDYGTVSTGTPVSFAAWQAGPPARDANSVAGTAASFTVTDFFVNQNAGDLHLKPTATPVLDAGTPVAGVTNDFDNQPRSATTPDIGADELVLASAGDLIISEFRLRGPAGANDEFIELYNTTGAALTVQAADASAGLAVAASDGVARCVVLNGTIIPAGGHFLCTNSPTYSLTTYPAGNGTTATGDLTYTTDIPDNAGIAIFNNATGGASFSLANRLDAVGSGSEANLTYKEGTGYPDLVTTLSVEHSFYRNLSSGLPKDTGDNLSDFVLVDTQGSCLFVAGCTGVTVDGNISGRHLGAPGPENLLSPLQRNATIKAFIIDNGCASSSGAGLASQTTCARHRDTTSNPGNNSTFGTLSIRRNFRNNTGAPVTRLRFRAVDMTTFPAVTGIADLRLLSSSSYSATCVSTGAGCAAPNSVITIDGTTREEPPSQPNGGGLNSSMSAGTITLLAPLAPGASINLQFLLGVQQGGSFRFFVNIEALP